MKTWKTAEVVELSIKETANGIIPGKEEVNRPGWGEWNDTNDFFKCDQDNNDVPQTPENSLS